MLGAATLLLAVASTGGYLEPCGCGGQEAGGLARRAALLAELRREQPGLVSLELGGFGANPGYHGVIARALAAMGTAACGLGPEDLTGYGPLGEALSQAAVPLTSLTPPLGDQRPPSSLVLAAGGRPCLLLSVAFGSLTSTELATAVNRELERWCEAAPRRPSLLLSHLGETGTERLLARLPDALRPTVVLLATADDLPAPAFDRLGATWVPVAHKGRALAVVSISGPDPPVVKVQQQLVTDGPRDPLVQGWVDAFYARQREHEVAAPVTEPSSPPAATCLPCHEPAVTGWRGTAHARAVETLVRASREVAECLRCHDEDFRRRGRPAPPGTDRGVVCASCHGSLENHLRGAGAPTTIAVAACLTCHDREHGPRFDTAVCLAQIAGACRGSVPPGRSGP